MGHGQWVTILSGLLITHHPSTITRLQRAASFPPGTCMASAPEFETKICKPQDLAARLKTLKRPLVFTNGVFDILHRGHASYLSQARALGASLLVAVNSDASVRLLGKGPDRPLNALADRMAMLAAMEAVDLVTWFDEETPLALINRVKPEILVK